ncbi:hypothetical protein M0R45_018183 [Rubus argutus]|uniref:Disease resistance protein RPS4B/Roq1-like leucine-rich repeats domain-containing protein n=1 Tax=Rubus argutus TaxID=59490 RepID=A0AAW1X1X0_RUBAR
MHDLIEEMGKDIVIQEGEPGKRSRLWNLDDVNHVLTNNTGTDKIKGIQVPWQQEKDEICLNATSVSKMKNLIFFSSGNGVGYSGTIDYLSNNLRWLDWPRCPLESFPSNFHPKELVLLKIKSISITRLWKGRKSYPNLTSMNLRGCFSLLELPDFSGIPNLKELTLHGCESLVELHDSVGSLHRLEILDAADCYKLVKLPREISLKSLQSINLYNCNRLEEFPKIIGKMDSLSSLDLSRSGIKELDSSIGNLIGLKDLSLHYCENLTTLPCSIYGLQNLETLDLCECSKLAAFPTNTKSLHDDNGDGSSSLPKLKVLRMGGCNLSDVDFLTTLDCLETLTELELLGNSFVSLPACISKFVNLKKLGLHYCKRLREIPELPPNLVEVDVSDCESLEKFWKLSKVLEGKESQGIELIYLLNCNRLCDNLGYNMDKMEHILLNNQDNAPFRVVFPLRTSEVPKWFNCWKDVIGPTGYRFACEFSIKISENLKWEKIGLAICAVSEGRNPNRCDYEVSINEVCIPRSVLYSFHVYKCGIISTTDHVWLEYIPLLPQPYYMCGVRFSNPYADKILKGCGVHLVCQESKDDEYSSNKVGGGGVEPTEQKRHCTDLLESENPQQKKHRGPKSIFQHQPDGFDNPAAAQSARANPDFSGLGSSILFNINSAYRAEDEIRRFSKKHGIYYFPCKWGTCCGVHLVCQQNKDGEYSSNKVGGGGAEPTEQKRHHTGLLESENPQQRGHRGPYSM